MALIADALEDLLISVHFLLAFCRSGEGWS